MTDRARPSLEEIEVELRRRFPDLLKKLGIAWELRGSRYWMLSPLRNDPSWTSFCFNRDNGLWKDFMLSSGGKGDPYSGRGALKFVCTFATNGQWKSERDARTRQIVRPGAVQWAIDFLGWSGKAPDPARAREAKEAIARQQADAERKAAETRKAAMGLWLHGTPLDDTDPASRYLLGRGIDRGALPGGEWPHALRFHPEVWAQDPERPMRGPHPAMLAAISDERVPGGFVAVHRTYLRNDAGAWGKLTWPNCKTGKQVKGSYAGASIRLTNGLSGKPLRQAAPDEWAQVGEGIEDVLTCAMANPAMRALAAVSVSNIGGLHFPVPLAGVQILGQNDDKPEAIEQFDRAMDQLAARGLEPAISKPPPRFKDWNDQLRGKVKENA